MTTFQMYLFTRVDKLLDTFGVSLIVLGLFLGVSALLFFITRAEYSTDAEIKTTKVLFFTTTPLFLFSLFGYVLIPSQKELAAIIVVPKILSAENVNNIQKIGADGIDIVKLATEYTKGILENKVKSNADNR